MQECDAKTSISQLDCEFYKPKKKDGDKCFYFVDLDGLHICSLIKEK